MNQCGLVIGRDVDGDTFELGKSLSESPDVLCELAEHLRRSLHDVDGGGSRGSKQPRHGGREDESCSVDTL